MEFKIIDSEADKELNKKIVLSFLSTIDSNALSTEVANSMGWGDGDPISIALNIIKQRVEQW
jgi:hypothetical protein